VSYGRDGDSQVHGDAWFDAGAQRVAADDIHRRRRCHLELAGGFCGHHDERDLDGTRQPGQVTELDAHAHTQVRECYQRVYDEKTKLFKYNSICPNHR